MINKNIKKIFLLVTLTILIIGLVSATETSKASPTKTTQMVKETQKVADTTAARSVTKKNNLKQNNISQSKKSGGSSTSTTTSKKYITTVTTYSDLVKQVNNAKKTKGASYTINLKKGTYKANSNMTWGDTKGTTKLVINGNGALLNGQSKYQFIDVSSGYNLELKNVKLMKFTSTDGGAIENRGTLTVKNSKISYNKASNNGGAIYNTGDDLVITNCEFKGNKAENHGGAIYLGEAEHLKISKSSFIKNIAENDGGAIKIYGTYNTNLVNNKFTSNKANYGGAIDNSPRSESYTYPYSYQRPRLESYTIPPTYGIIGYDSVWTGTMYTSVPRWGYSGGGTGYRTVYDYVTETRTGYHYYGENTTITKNLFTKNYAKKTGGAIYTTLDGTKITKNKFLSNKANSSQVFYADEYDTTIKNNYIYYKSIDKASNVNLTKNNKLINEKNYKSVLTMKLNAKKVKVGKTIQVKLTLKNGNKKALNKQKVRVTVGSGTYSFTTNKKGISTRKIKLTKAGKFNVVALYEGNAYHALAKKQTKITVKK